MLRIVALTLVIGFVAGCHTDPNVRKKKYLASGDRFSAEGKYREAAIQYENSLKADKNFPAAHFALAKAYMHMGAYSAAYREFSRTVDLQPTNYEARVDLGNMLISVGKTDDAEKQAKAVFAGDPNNPDLHALLSAIALKRGDRQKAMAEIQKAIQLGPNRSAFYDNLAVMQQRDPAQQAQAEDSFKKAVAVDPKSVNAKVLLSAYYAISGRYPQAEQAGRDAIATDPKSIPARRNLAQVYLAEGNTAQAENVLRQASQDLSDDPRGVSLLADYYTTTHQDEKARNEYASLVAKHPKNVDLQKAYLRSLIQVHDYNTAKGVAGQLMKKDSKDPEVAALNGIVLLNEGKTNDAINALQDGAKNFPQDPFIQYWLGVAALRGGNPSLAQRSFQKVVSLQPRAADALDQLAQIAERQGDINLLSSVAEKSIKAIPNFAGGYVWRAEAEMHQGSTDKAEADLKTAMQVAPTSPQAYFELGTLRFTQKRFPEGEAMLEKALQYNPNMVQALRLLVAYDLYRKQPAAALARINAQIQKSPRNSGLIDLLAGLQIQLNQLDQASATAQNAMRMNPSDPDAVMLFAQAAVRSGKTAGAISVWQSWVNAHPNDANALALLGTLEDASGNRQAAEANYHRALAIQPQQPIAANNLAYLMLQEGGDVDVALSLAQTARQAMPNSPDTADTLAWAYYHKGTYQFARDLLEDALKETPNNATVQYHLGMVYLKLLDKGNAELHLKKAVTLGKGTPTAASAQSALQQLG
ncbi:MAG TPA: tetratricopeptide repeat protein [Terracidiphilus sp.]|nr:tetratricopeptide repeat protein [Terracidiphilus sp.]